MDYTEIGAAFYFKGTQPSNVISQRSVYSMCFIGGKDENGGGIFYLNENIHFTE